jgi:hypothetical protein
MTGLVDQLPEIERPEEYRRVPSPKKRTTSGARRSGETTAKPPFFELPEHRTLFFRNSFQPD